VELAFVSGEFLEYTLPKDKHYLYKYFTTELQKQFMHYLIIFGSDKKFIEHTGYDCSERWRIDQRRRLQRLQADHQTAKAAMNFEVLAKIESGDYDV
jgi:hypothetical protein